MTEVEYVREHEVIVDRGDLIAATAALEAVVIDMQAKGRHEEEIETILARLKSLLGLKDTQK